MNRSEARVLLTISTIHRPATDLGFLLHKNPDRHHVAELGFGTAHVFYPEASDERCSAAVLVDIDPIGLVRDRNPAGRFPLAHYVNDRPYVASSYLSVALGRLFGTAMSGRSKERQHVADQAIPLEAWMPVAPCRGGEDLARRLFEPLGYLTRAQALPLDPQFPEWGDSRYLSLRISARLRLRDLLHHLFVLLPVLDDDKHYWVGADEVAKLLRRGGEWLAGHPDRDLIARRYLRHDQRLTSGALARLFEDEAGDPDRRDQESDAGEESVERKVSGGHSLHEQRLAAVLAVITGSGACRVLDLGCGSGKLIAELLKERGLERIVGLDVSHRALETAARRLHLDGMAPRQRERVELLHGSLTYRDGRLRGFDAAAVVEVIEHLDAPRLGAFERALFGYARPATVIVTTPNAEYNALLQGVPDGSFRHADHRFEWTRAQFAEWAARVAARHDYRVELSGIGPENDEFGCPSQLAVFRR
ncbi:MAG TPA: 3' terminal RNA ribose 2'-O-methyltransferase Hen1 [Streptosporangiaceae bacterium]|nr:3' terminal RNA ribose 2'-O-methyltransferase Hen1 [Streptosporangiaceae bacterium]